jgi:hypothetical protein
MTKPAVARTF